MSYLRMSPVLPFATALLFFACESKTGTAPPTQSTAPSRPVPAPREVLDAANLYSSVVMVTTNATKTEGGEVECSGVFIAPRLALTSARCVCVQRRSRTAPAKSHPPLHAPACARNTTVTLASYEASAGEESFRFQHREYPGKVRPHPALKIQYDDDGAITSAHADLAVILLDRPVADLVPAALAQTEVKVGEELVLVAYVHAEEQGGIYRTRHFSKASVKGLVSGEGRFSTDRPAPGFHASAGGGPYLRESEEGVLLVGISSGEAGEGAASTSTLFYQDWLLAEIQHATQEPTPDSGVPY